MKVTIERDLLGEMLGSVVPCLPTRTPMMLYNNLLLNVAGNEMTVTATNGDVFVRRRAAINHASEEGRAVVAGRKFYDFVREMAAAEVVLRTTERQLIIEAGKVRAALTTINPAEYPNMPEMPDSPKVQFSLAMLESMYGAVGFAVSKDQAQVVMSGLNWEISKTESRLVATDGHRLAMAVRKGKFASRLKILVTPEVFALLPHGEADFEVAADPAKVGLVFKDLTIIARLIDAAFPDYERVIPKDAPFRAIVDRDQLEAAVRRAAVLAHPIGKVISMAFSSSKLAISAENPDLGTSEEELDCEYVGDAIRVGFNASYVLEVLRRTAPGRVRMEMTGPLAPVKIQMLEPNADGQDVFLMMPIRLD